MTVELITTATPEIHEAMGRLIPQLSRSAAPMSEADVERILNEDPFYVAEVIQARLIREWNPVIRAF